jgi:hypothetical protein
MRKSERMTLVKDALELLRQTRAQLHDESHVSLAKGIDEAIEKLECIERGRNADPERIDRILELIGKALTATPSIIEIVKKITDR